MPATITAALTFRPEPVAHHHGLRVESWRRVVAGPWAYPSPQTCRDFSSSGLWIGPHDDEDQQVLVCFSCGLDCT
jgi:hypothetical protein